MKIAKKEEDGKILVTFTHNDVSVVRMVDPFLTKDGSVDKEETESYIQGLSIAIQDKIEMGLITKESVKYFSTDLKPVEPPVHQQEQSKSEE